MCEMCARSTGPNMTKSHPAKALLDAANSAHDRRPSAPLMTVEVVQVGERYSAVLVAMRPLGMNQPPEGDDRIAALVREIVRRACYQLLPFAERESWKDERLGITARALEFEGMTQADLMRASPEEMIGRFIEITRKRRGNSEADVLKERMDQLLGEFRKSGGT